MRKRRATIITIATAAVGTQDVREGLVSLYAPVLLLCLPLRWPHHRCCEEAEMYPVYFCVMTISEGEAGDS
jgi:hypothetical protein